MRRPGRALLGLFLSLATLADAAAQENKDLELIPPSIQTSGSTGSEAGKAGAQQAAANSGHGKVYLENALTLSSVRNDLVVPLPPPNAPDWENRTSIDATEQWNLGSKFTASVSDRFNLTGEQHIEYPSSQIVRNDFREGYLTWEALTRTYLEAGRINLRNGIALGFNPTDFFKGRTLLDQASLDPSVIREDRLGTLMVRGQTIWTGGSASVAFAPKLYDPSAITEAVPYGFSPRFDHTNASNRFLGSLNLDVADLSPQALIYHEGRQTLLGANLSRPVGQSIVIYGEWSGGNQSSLIAQALHYGQETGTLPEYAPVLPPSSTKDRFDSALSIGGSWSSAAKVTVNLEYHYYEPGLSRQELRDWFRIGATSPDSLLVTGDLWYLRGFANDQQQPWVQQQLFVRLDWVDAFVPHLELTAFAFVDLYDGSVLSQLSANYYLSDSWTIGAYASRNAGSARSERGSNPQAANVIVQLLRYF